MISLQKLIKSSSSHGKSELNRINYLDGWRGLAITSVLFAHFLPVAGLDLGKMGVDIFFVLSGLLMSKILFIKRTPLKIFYKRRISRIFPVFFIFLTSISLLSYIYNLSNEHQNYLYSLFFLRSYLPVSPDLWHTGLPIGHLWSLNVEEHCYIILSLITLIRFIKNREAIILLALGCGAIILQFIYIRYPDIASSNYHLKTEIVASHLFISAGYFLIKHHFEQNITPWMPVLSFILGILCYSELSPWYASWLISPFLFAFSVNHLDKAPAITLRFLSTKPLQLLGIWSYSIYLWQQPFYYYGTKFGELFTYAGPLFLTLGLLSGILSFYYIENPIRKYLNNRW